MNWKDFCLLSSSLLIVSCSDINNAKYQDMSYLEQPPTLEIEEQPVVAEVDEDENIDRGLGEVVALAGPEDEPIIKIKKMFDRSWDIVEKALKYNEITITDKNRDEGVFYLIFDPDAKTKGKSGMFDNMAFFFFEDEYDEAAYKLTVAWRETDSEVIAQVLHQKDEHLLDDDEDEEDFSGSVDPGGILIKKLYITIRDDLPLD